MRIQKTVKYYMKNLNESYIGMETAQTKKNVLQLVCEATLEILSITERGEHSEADSASPTKRSSSSPTTTFLSVLATPIPASIEN